MARPWNYHSNVKCCPTCEGDGRVHSQRRPSTWDPYPETDCPDCAGPHEPECAVCGYNLPIAGYDCLACDTVAALHPHELKAFNADAFAAALKVAVDKALADSLQPEPKPTSRLRDLLSAWIELDSVLSAAYCQPGDAELLVDRIEDDRWEAAQALREYLVCDFGLNDGMLRKLGEVLT